MGTNDKLQVINWATFFLYVTKEEKLISKVAQSCVYFNALYVDSSDWGLKRKTLQVIHFCLQRSKETKQCIVARNKALNGLKKDGWNCSLNYVSQLHFILGIKQNNAPIILKNMFNDYNVNANFGFQWQQELPSSTSKRPYVENPLRARNNASPHSIWINWASASQIHILDRLWSVPCAASVMLMYSLALEVIEQYCFLNLITIPDI